MRKNQRTIQKPAELEGTGLFSGSSGKVRVQPAPANAGITFIRTDLPNRPRLPVSPDTVSSKFRRSAVLGENVDPLVHCGGRYRATVRLPGREPDWAHVRASSYWTSW